MHFSPLQEHKKYLFFYLHKTRYTTHDYEGCVLKNIAHEP